MSCNKRRSELACRSVCLCNRMHIHWHGTQGMQLSVFENPRKYGCVGRRWARTCAWAATATSRRARRLTSTSCRRPSAWTSRCWHTMSSRAGLFLSSFIPWGRKQLGSLPHEDSQGAIHGQLLPLAPTRCAHADLISVTNLQAVPGIMHWHCARQAPPDKWQLRGQAPAAVLRGGAASGRLGCHARARAGHGCCCKGAESVVNTAGALANLWPRPPLRSAGENVN